MGGNVMENTYMFRKLFITGYNVITYLFTIWYMDSYTFSSRFKINKRIQWEVAGEIRPGSR
jgi:hypothetical protein